MRCAYVPFSGQATRITAFVIAGLSRFEVIDFKQQRSCSASIDEDAKVQADYDSDQFLPK